MNKSILSWFEIPVTDMDRAKAFYEAILQIELQDLPMDGLLMSAFPTMSDDNVTGGALVKSDMHKVSQGTGVAIYLKCEDCANEESRVEAAGGKVLQPKTSIGEFGYFAMIQDTEGNVLGFHSNA